MIDLWSAPPEIAGAVGAGVVGLVLLVLEWRRRRRCGRGATPLPDSVRQDDAFTPSVGAARSDQLRRGLAKTRQGFLTRLRPVLRQRRLDTKALEEIEIALLGADVGSGMTERLLGSLRGHRGDVAESVRQQLEGAMIAILESATAPPRGLTAKPWVIMVVGVNGVGKTTSIGKLAMRYGASGKSVLLIAGDTFRAAAIEQLAVWADRAHASLIRQQQGSDPGAVVYDGIRAAVARGVDVVIVDTAGRLHTKSNLMEELRKVRRVIARELPDAPHETLLVLDAVTGQNGVVQARAFAEVLGVSGVILSKLDGTAKGGVVLAVAGELRVPIRYVGVGEGVDDLREFDAQQFVCALLGTEERDSLDT